METIKYAFSSENWVEECGITVKLDIKVIYNNVHTQTNFLSQFIDTKQ